MDMKIIKNCFCGINRNVNEFAFDQTETSIIMKVRDYVKSVLEDHSYKYFHTTTDIEDVAKSQNIITTPIGKLFGTSLTEDLYQTEDQYDYAEGDFLIHKMLKCCERNFNVMPTSNRFDDELKHYCAYMRIIGGPLNYESFKANAFRAVPGLSAVDRLIAKEKSHSLEGQIRSKELLKYLNDLNLPLIVTLCEDATRIIGRPQYDPSSNQIVGFTLPLDKNCLPQTGFFQARSAAEIEATFYKNISTGESRKPANHINVIMAQPLCEGIPPFCLLVFGSDNSYTAVQVKNRRNYIVEELSSLGIRVLAFGSDSDTRYNSTMRDKLQVGFKRQPVDPPSDFPAWFNIQYVKSSSPNWYVPIQDTIHINRYLNTKLKIGRHTISYQHLKHLVQRFPKNLHNLTHAIIQPKDRQKFDHVLRICSEEVIDLLERNVSGTSGTVFYLRLIRKTLRSFLDTSMTPLERIRSIWFVVFALRGWRKSILKAKRKLDDNFLSSNCYSCIEINAQSLVLVLLHLKENNLDHLFLPHTLGSQQCESIFRQLRSMTSTYSTKTNFSILEILHRLYKIELLNKITHIKLKHVNFPRIGRQSKEQNTYFPSSKRQENNSKILPSKDELIENIELAKLQAMEYLESLGESIPLQVLKIV